MHVLVKLQKREYNMSSVPCAKYRYRRTILRSNSKRQLEPDMGPGLGNQNSPSEGAVADNLPPGIGGGLDELPPLGVPVGRHARGEDEEGRHHRHDEH